MKTKKSPKSICHWNKCNESSGGMYYCEKHRNYYKEYMSQDRYKDVNRLRMRKTRLTKRPPDLGQAVARDDNQGDAPSG